MPIKVIAKIQCRSGNSDSVPQLSKGEFGWSINDRKLYIGNGAIADGAPAIGNTEILTEFSDVLGLSKSYTFSGDAGGYVTQTGSNPNNPTSRSLQNKLDDIISVKDFGAKGDGVTDDTLAINRAYYEVFCRDSNPETRRSVYFPAGRYIISDIVKIPTWAKTFGDGVDSTVIVQTNAAAIGTACLSDSKHQTFENIGNNGASLPRYIDIRDMSFHNDTSNHVFLLFSASSIRFERVKFKGNVPTPDAVGTGKSAVLMNGTAINKTHNIKFDQCCFMNIQFGIASDDDIYSVTLNASNFNLLYKAVKLGENVTGVGASVIGPQSFSIMNSEFDKIYSVGIHAYQAYGVNSLNNYFVNVGNHNSITPYDNCIVYAYDGNTSINDRFSRTDADNLVIPRISYGTTKTIYSNPLTGVSIGTFNISQPVRVTLSDNTTEGSIASFPSRSASIVYTIQRGTSHRIGRLLLVASAAGANLVDTSAVDLALGVTFNVNYSSGSANLTYTTTSTGKAASLTYVVETLL